MRPTSAPGAAPKGHRVGDIPLRCRDRILPGRPAAVTLGPFSRIATPCLLARPRSELRQRLAHLALKPTPIHIGRWRPEPSQNLRHLAARKARPGRRAALGLIHHHRHNHHPFAAACAHGGSLHLATRDYRQQQTHALRSLLVEGQHNEAPTLFATLAATGASPVESSTGNVISVPEPTTVLMTP